MTVSFGKPPTPASSPIADRVDVIFESPINVEYPEYGASPSAPASQNALALAAAVAKVPSAGGDVLIPRPLSYDSTLTLRDGVRLMGLGGQQRWRSAASGTQLTYTGTGAAVSIANGSADTRESIEIHNVRFDGTGLSGAVDGLVIDGTAGSGTKYVEGVQLGNCTFSNFPRYQARLDGLLIDITFDHCSFNNVASPSGNDLVRCLQTSGTSGKTITQVTFNDPLFAQYGSELSSGVGAWCFHGNATDVRFIGGTLTTNGQAGGSGIWSGPLHLFGTHLEGIPASVSGVGIRVSGGPHTIIPAYCASFTTGLQIGDPTTATQSCIGTTVFGMIGGNTTDVRIVAGGSRAGTKILSLPETTGSPAVIANDRETSDGVREVFYAHSRGSLVLPGLANTDALNYSIYTSSADGRLYFRDNTGTARVLY